MSFSTYFALILAFLCISIQSVSSYNGRKFVVSYSNQKVEKPQAHLKAIGNILTPEEFESITTKSTSKIPCVIDFQKSNCKPCKKIAPDFEALSVKYDGKVRFFKIDADSSKEALSLMKNNGIKSVPTFYVYVEGIKVNTILGAHLDEVEETLISELKKGE
jgi:thioredoxin 1